MITSKDLAHLKSLKKGDKLTDQDVKLIQSLTHHITPMTLDERPIIRVRCGRKEASLSPESVVQIHSTSGSSTLITEKGEHWCTSHSLKRIEQIWGDSFIRLDRNHAINKDWIKGTRRGDDGSCQIVTLKDDVMNISRRCYAQMRKLFS